MRYICILLALTSCTTTRYPEYTELPEYPYKALWCPNETPDMCKMGGHFKELNGCLKFMGKFQPNDLSRGYWCCAWLDDRTGEPVYVRLNRGGAR